MSVIELDDEIAELLGGRNPQLDRAAKEAIVMELYSEAAISSGRVSRSSGARRG